MPKPKLYCRLCYQELFDTPSFVEGVARYTDKAWDEWLCWPHTEGVPFHDPIEVPDNG